ncbi:MAG: transposase [Holdemanella porci]
MIALPVIICHLPPICKRGAKIKKTLINWSQEIINSFTFIDGRRITNGIMESKNGIIKEIKNNAKDIKTF